MFYCLPAIVPSFIYCGDYSRPICSMFDPIHNNWIKPFPNFNCLSLASKGSTDREGQFFHFRFHYNTP